MKTISAHDISWGRMNGPDSPFVGIIEASTAGIPPGAVPNTIRVQGVHATRTFTSIRNRSNQHVTVMEQVGGGGEIHILND